MIAVLTITILNRRKSTCFSKGEGHRLASPRRRRVLQPVAVSG